LTYEFISYFRRNRYQCIKTSPTLKCIKSVRLQEHFPFSSFISFRCKISVRTRRAIIKSMLSKHNKCNNAVTMIIILYYLILCIKATLNLIRNSNNISISNLSRQCAINAMIAIIIMICVLVV